jgi:hypothetical protein
MAADAPATRPAASRKLGFLSLRDADRNQIYRQLLCHPTPIRGSDVQLSSQLLRTCRQVYTEGRPILYGENMFKITLTNAPGASASGIYHSHALDGLYDTEDQEQSGNTSKGKNTQMRHTNPLKSLRMLHIEIVYASLYPLGLLRSAVRTVVEQLNLVTEKIHFLQLEYHNWEREKEDMLSDYYYYHEANNRDGEGEINDEECVSMLRTWLGLLRNVERVEVTGLPDPDASLLAAKIKVRGNNKSPYFTHAARGLPLVHLTDLYKALEKHVGGIEYLQEDMREAAWAVEHDDLKMFKACKTAIFWRVEDRWRDLLNEDVLQGIEEDADEEEGETDLEDGEGTTPMCYFTPAGRRRE